MQATLYAQIRTLIADVKSRYEDVEISVIESTLSMASPTCAVVD